MNPLDKKWLATFYEEGTWTPTYLGNTTAGVTTYSTQQGSYVRIGSLVIVTGTIVWTAATGTGTALFSLPFTIANVANQNFSGSVRTTDMTFAAGTPQLIMVPNTARFLLQSPASNAASTTLTMEAAGNIVFTVMYFVDL